MIGLHVGIGTFPGWASSLSTDTLGEGTRSSAIAYLNGGTSSYKWKAWIGPGSISRCQKE